MKRSLVCFTTFLLGLVIAVVVSSSPSPSRDGEESFDLLRDSFLFKATTAGRHPSTKQETPKRQIDASLELQPVVIVPALGNSNLYLKLHEVHPDHFYCRKNQDDYSLIWIPEDKIYVPGFIECWLYYLNFTYDPTTHQYNSAPGVEIDVLNYGDSVAAIEYVDPIRSKYPMWIDIVEALTGVGYVPGKTLFSAPYDFRVGPDAFGAQYDALKQLIETVYAANDNKPVVLCSLSLGGPYTHLFLTSHVSQSWKDQYISSFVSYSGVFAGSTEALSTILSGGNQGAKFPKLAKQFRDLARTWGSVNWMVPEVSFWGDQVFVSTPEKNFTMSEMGELYPLFEAQEAFEIYQGVYNYSTLQDPGVKVYCYYGYNISTLFTLSYNSTDYNNAIPEMTYLDGDNTAVVASLALCENWSNVTVISVANMPHAGFVYDQPTINQLIDIVTNQPLRTARPPVSNCSGSSC